jgi:hypothetical protein
MAEFKNSASPPACIFATYDAHQCNPDVDNFVLDAACGKTVGGSCMNDDCTTKCIQKAMLGDPSGYVDHKSQSLANGISDYATPSPLNGCTITPDGEYKLVAAAGGAEIAKVQLYDIDDGSLHAYVGVAIATSSSTMELVGTMQSAKVYHATSSGKPYRIYLHQ